MSSSRLRLMLAAAVATGSLLLGVLVLSRSSEQSSEQAAANVQATGFYGSKLPKGYEAPRFLLEDQDSRRVDSGELGGSPALVTFTYSNCDESCPSQVQLMRSAMDDLGRDIPAYAISVDPANDTRDSARKFLAEQRVLGRISFLLGDRRRLARVWKGFGVQPQQKDQEHHARIVLVDRSGMQRVGYTVGQVTGQQIAQDIRRLTTATPTS